MSTTFVKLLPLEMGEITQFKEPTEEVKPNEKIICEMTDDQKKLFTLVWSYRRSVIDYKTKITFEGSSPELEAKFSEAVEKAEVLWNLLWVTVKTHCGLWVKNVIMVFAKDGR